MVRRWRSDFRRNFVFQAYVPVARRRAQARRFAQLKARDGCLLQPVQISGRDIATTFWGRAWCQNLERYSDFENRLPRGRTYVRNGSVIDLQIGRGRITASVSGSDVYEVTVQIAPLRRADWNRIKRDCTQSIDSLMDLLQGQFSQGVMERLTRQGEGLFPRPKEITMSCSCPDGAVLCKHLAAVLYGVGSRLDNDPAMLFLLRQVDHRELISQAVGAANLDAALNTEGAGTLEQEDLAELFGIELDASGPHRGTAPATAAKAPPTAKSLAGSRRRSSRKPAKGQAAHRGRTARKRAAAPIAKSAAAGNVTKPKKKATRAKVAAAAAGPPQRRPTPRKK